MSITEWIKEWALPLSAGATFLLSLATFWSILELRSARKDERRDHALDNILTWAEELDELIGESAFDLTSEKMFATKRKLLRIRDQISAKLQLSRVFKKEKLPSALADVRDALDKFEQLQNNEPIEPARYALELSIKKLIHAMLDIRTNN